jgi:beta-aspartyl-peptidase (threonine type)
VACDVHGNVAAATSTGGTTGKLPGRIGDAPLINAGTWADARVAVSCTGIGERFVLAGTARMVAARVELLDEPIEQAAAMVMDSMPPESGGLIAVDHTGVVTLPFTSSGMYRGWATADGSSGIGIGP